jgi:hypothetical protein
LALKWIFNFINTLTLPPIIGWFPSQLLWIIGSQKSRTAMKISALPLKPAHKRSVICPRLIKRCTLTVIVVWNYFKLLGSSIQSA